MYPHNSGYCHLNTITDTQVTTFSVCLSAIMYYSPDCHFHYIPGASLMLDDIYLLIPILLHTKHPMPHPKSKRKIVKRMKSTNIVNYINNQIQIQIQIPTNNSRKIMSIIKAFIFNIFYFH